MPIERQRLSEWIKSKTQPYIVYKKYTLKTQVKSKGIEKNIPC